MYASTPHRVARGNTAYNVCFVRLAVYPCVQNTVNTMFRKYYANFLKQTYKLQYGCILGQIKASDSGVKR